MRFQQCLECQRPHIWALGLWKIKEWILLPGLFQCLDFLIFHHNEFIWSIRYHMIHMIWTISYKRFSESMLKESILTNFSKVWMLELWCVWLRSCWPQHWFLKRHLKKSKSFPVLLAYRKYNFANLSEPKLAVSLEGPFKMKAETKLSLTPSKCDDIEFFGEKMNVCADETITQVISRSSWMKLIWLRI